MKSNSDIDSQLVIQFQSGDKEALPELVERWHKQFCNKAYWLVKDQDVAKDIAQDSWKVIINKIDTLNDTKSFGGWAMRIVYTKSFDWLRAQSKLQLRQYEYYKAQDQYESVVEDNEQLKVELLKAIKALPVNQQTVIKLFYVESYSLKDISDILQISIGTAKSRLFHAREKLKSILKVYKGQ